MQVANMLRDPNSMVRNFVLSLDSASVMIDDQLDTNISNLLKEIVTLMTKTENEYKKGIHLFDSSQKDFTAQTKLSDDVNAIVGGCGKAEVLKATYFKLLKERKIREMKTNPTKYNISDNDLDNLKMIKVLSKIYLSKKIDKATPGEFMQLLMILEAIKVNNKFDDLYLKVKKALTEDMDTDKYTEAIMKDEGIMSRIE